MGGKKKSKQSCLPKGKVKIVCKTLSHALWLLKNQIKYASILHTLKFHNSSVNI